MVYKWCIVPQCISTSIKTPEKNFVSVPTNPKRRKLWLQLAHRDPSSIVSHSNVFMCEDHFNMERTVKNYMKYKMGFSKKILLAHDAVPTKFHCQKIHKRSLSDDESSPQEYFLKRQIVNVIKESVQIQNDTETHTESLLKENEIKSEDIKLEELSETENELTITNVVNMQDRTQMVQTQLQNDGISILPIKIETICYKPSQEVIKKEKIALEDEKSESDISYFGSNNVPTFIETSSSTVTATDSDSNITDYTYENFVQLQSLKNTLHYIEKKPMMYVGIPKELYFFIRLVHKYTNIKTEHILLCLKKIRTNCTFSELGDNFGISLSFARKVFLRNIPILSCYLENFVVKLDRKLVKKNIPFAFRHNHNKFSCIIDCLEIDIQKPSKALHQTLTWSDYKKRNTVKYLISCTPNGLVNFVSKGFGGRTSDITIVENSNFLDGLEMGTCILANRGFKHLEQALHEKGMTLMRPPSVKTGEQLSKLEFQRIKIITSLQVHIKRVVRRLREFHMLKQHSEINVTIQSVLDHVIIIACGLINLQNSLI